MSGDSKPVLNETSPDMDRCVEQASTSGTELTNFKTTIPMEHVSSEKHKQSSQPADSSEYASDDTHLTLDTLPSEIFLHICSFLDAKFVIQTLSKVCSLFHDVVNDNIFWKIRLGNRWNKKYPPIPGRFSHLLCSIYIFLFKGNNYFTHVRYSNDFDLNLIQ